MNDTVKRKENVNHNTTKEANMTEQERINQLESRINTYFMIHASLRHQGVNDLHYYRQAMNALKELKELMNKQNNGEYHEIIKMVA